jgi:hypothetical protein
MARQPTRKETIKNNIVTQLLNIADTIENEEEQKLIRGIASLINLKNNVDLKHLKKIKIIDITKKININIEDINKEIKENLKIKK